MANNYDSDDPTIPVQPPSPQQNKQGRLVLGSFKDQARSSQRQPYQYSPTPQPQGEQPTIIYPQQQPVSPNKQGPASRGRVEQPTQYPQRPPVSPSQQVPPGSAPAVYPNIRQSPYPQPGQMAGAPGTGMGKAGRRRKGPRIGCLATLVVVLLIGAFTFFTGQRVLAFGSAISNQSPLSTQTGYMGTSDRVNLLVMGFGGGGHDGAYLTDSILVISVLPKSHHTSLISVPRDLWIQYPPNSGRYAKINAVYPDAAGTANADPNAGGAAATQKVSLVTGMTVNYWLTIDFTGFKQVIDSLGGIDVYVPDSFNACYPKNDDAAVDPSWIKVQFNKGMQHMNGATAISYARAREPLEVCGMGTSQNLAELTDFGRSARQQIIINAVLAQVKQVSTWPRLYGTMDALQKSIRTNLSLADLSALALNMDLKDPKAAHIGLSNQNVLQDAQSNDGQYILLPQNGNWQGISDYIKQHLYN
ncbi:MAG TPA: LCP family protein [Ktedonosporobacter sp.]|nr:LCP family protein [Ktedonosporobacter sp.]